MAKTIKITLYTPKELWTKFCNWVFWPRHKKCAEWCDFYDGVLCAKVEEILEAERKNVFISDDAAERLELAIKSASHEVSEATAEMMSEPF